MKYGTPLEVANALLDFGLITEEQADEAFAIYQERECRLHEEAVWWVTLAILAWENETPLWKRILDAGRPSHSWVTAWVYERQYR